MAAATQPTPEELRVAWVFEARYRKPPDQPLPEMAALRQLVEREYQQKTREEQLAYYGGVVNMIARQDEMAEAMRLLDESPYSADFAPTRMELVDLRTCLNLYVGVYNALRSYHTCILEVETILNAQVSNEVTQRRLAEQRQGYGRCVDEYQGHVGRIQAEIRVKAQWALNDKMPYNNAFVREKRASMVRQKNQENSSLDETAGKWRLANVLGANQGDTTLWLQYNDENKIIDRLVKKDQMLAEGAFLSADYWYGDVRDHENRVPLEYALQDKCAAADPQTFPGMLGWKQNIADLTVRMYMQYCPHADLQSLITIYYSKPEAERQPIPEPLVWMIFERMVQASLVMRQGTADVEELGALQIVHRDIKAPNVFLDIPNPSLFPSYPAPKLGDFGLALETSISDPFNPRMYALAGGTRPFYAPEQLMFLQYNTSELRNQTPLLDYTNVFGIGRLMWHLVSGHQFVHGALQPDYIDESKPDWPKTPFMEHHYTPQLIALIYGCTKFKPEERWGLTELQARVRDDVEKLPEPLREYIEKARAGVSPVGIDFFPVQYRADEYKLGTADAW